jgi:hypothetical protein
VGVFVLCKEENPMTESKNYQRKLRKLSQKIEKTKQAEKALKEEFKRHNEIEKMVNLQTDKIKNFIVKNIENNLRRKIKNIRKTFWIRFMKKFHKKKCTRNCLETALNCKIYNLNSILKLTRKTQNSHK